MTERVVIVQSGFLGDAVLASGMLRAIDGAARGIEVGLVVRSEFADLFGGHPALRRVHRLDKRRRGGTAELIAELREYGYDTALVPHRSFRSAAAVWRAGIGRRIGFRQSDAPWLLTERVDYDIALHETARNARLLAQIGIEPGGDDRRPWLIPDAGALVAVRERLHRGASHDQAPIVVMAPGSVWPTKRWTAEGYAGAARELSARGYYVLLAGSPAERELCETIAERASLEHGRVLCGELSLRELVALIAMAGRVVTNDSAPLHLAESVGTPVTAIFGPTVPEFGFGPQAGRSSVIQVEGLPCRPCRIHGSRRCPIGTHVCMTSITAERVVADVTQ